MPADGASDPFTAFSFRVDLWLPGAKAPLCDGAFAACEGLEVRFDVRTLQEGGSAGSQRLLSGPVSYGHLTLRRGMTSSFDLWDWCAAVVRDGGPRADGRIVVLAPDGQTERARFRLRGCLPVRLRGPDLNAGGSAVAIEELELACESVSLESQEAGTDGAAAAPERAELRELDQHFEREINRKRWVRAQVNPQSLQVSYTNPQPDAGGAGIARLTLELWFDVGGRSSRPRSHPHDVQRVTDAVAYFITPRRAPGGKGLLAPAVRLVWGPFSFDGHMDALHQTLDLFSPDGRPARARLTVSLSRPWIAR